MKVNAMTDESKPEFVELRLSLTKKQIHKMTRIKRWEERSASVNIVLGLGPRR